ncbi:lymphocyte antigen 75 [Fundulus heteroclitus]|uniref:lymphocyte antigen 75 n=1 Tax=Fundulus heteroclitus TaxID=8078 RepID=UPI00165B3E63|nr:lymphocyte antigen 75 [Fundulus heteroclitus]
MLNMKSSLLGPLVLLVFSGMIECKPKYYIPFNFGLTWDEARGFCQKYFTDLATNFTSSDLESMDLKQQLVWIGLKKKKDADGWIWSDSKSHKPNWAENEPSSGRDCAAVHFSDKKLYAWICSSRRMFYCQKEGNYTFVNKSKSWDDASSYCKTINYKHLATFECSDMETIFTEKDFPVWVGMRREVISDGFRWIITTSNYNKWMDGEPRDSRHCVTISSQTKLMATENCSVDLPFVCMSDENIVILVKENKSWEEALEHCRGISNSVLRYDLVSVQPGDEHQHIMSKAMEADTEEVWTGLRFLGDEWLWVNGESMMGSHLPQCPMQQQRCGALSKKTSSLKTRDCSERKNFLCYGYTP